MDKEKSRQQGVVYGDDDCISVLIIGTNPYRLAGEYEVLINAIDSEDEPVSFTCCIKEDMIRDFITAEGLGKDEDIFTA